MDVLEIHCRKSSEKFRFCFYKMSTIIYLKNKSLINVRIALYINN